MRNQLLINGQWRGAEGEGIEVLNPATGETLTSVADASLLDAKDAMRAAVEAQADWAATPPRERAELLRRSFTLVTERAEDFARLITQEMGKSLTEARAEVTYGAEFLRWFSEEAPRITGRSGLLPEGTLQHLVARRAVGPCLLITPWNFPLAMATRKLGPALAAGCTSVIKPASATPLTTLLLGEVLLEAGVPDGVVNIITFSDHDLTDELLSYPGLRKLSFTGSTPVGRSLMAKASNQVLRISMELGGNAPLIVFDDADLEVAVEGALAAKLRNVGQACTAADRFIIHESVAGEFVERLEAGMRAKKLGNGLDEAVDIGPLISAAARDEIDGLVQRAVAGGAELRCGGEILDGPGYFYPPTLLTSVAPDAEIMTTEIFGPVAAVTTFSTEQEALDIANSVDVGLAGYVFSSDQSRLYRMIDQLQVGLIAWNSGVVSNAAAPFGGVKLSGLGREGSAEGIDEYLESVYVGMPA